MADGVAQAEQDPSIDVVAPAHAAAPVPADEGPAPTAAPPSDDVARGKTIHGEAANAGHRVLAPDDAEVEAYLETALNAPAPARTTVI